MLDLILKALRGSQSEALTDAQKRVIRDEVEQHLKRLPIETYQAINALIKDRVPRLKAATRAIAWTAGFALIVIAGVFFTVTAKNAAKEVTRMLAQSEAGKKIKAITEFHREAEGKLVLISASATDATNRLADLRRRLSELESIDNIVRYSADGKLYLRTTDGIVWIERRDGTGPRLSFVVIDSGVTMGINQREK